MTADSYGFIVYTYRIQALLSPRLRCLQRWLGMSFGVTYGEDHMEFYALVNELIEDWMIPMEPSATQVVMTGVTFT